MARSYTSSLVMAQLGLLDAAGYAAGQRGTDWVATETTHTFVLEGRRDVQFTYADGQQNPIEEGNQQVGYWLWGGEKITEAQIVLSDEDPSLDTLIAATLQVTITPSSYYQFYTEEEDNAYRPLLYALLTSAAQGADGNDGATYFWNRIFSRCKARVRSGNLDFQGGNANRTLILTPYSTNTTPFGISLATMGFGLSVGKINTFKFKSNKLLHITSHKKDGILTSYTTLYKPDSSSAVAATGANFQTINGAVANPTSVTPATGVVVGTAGVSGDKVVMMYEHNNVTV